MTTWQFVADMASSTPTVLLDLNVPPLTVAPGYTLNPPQYEKSRTGGVLRHGQTVTRSVAQNRTIHLPLQVVGATAAAHAGAVEALGRLLAVDGFLKYQPNNTVQPVFFRTFADPDYAAEVRGILACAVQYQLITLEIEAEPFAYGPRIEATGSPFTVSNNPAAGTNPCRFDITGVLGDVETPLLLVATSTAVTGSPSGFASKWTHFATRRRGTPSNYSNVIQAEDMVLGTNAVVTADASMSNGSRVTVTPGTTAMSLRLSDSFPGNGVSSIDARGEYRVYGRFTKTTATDTWDVQLKYGLDATAPVANDIRRLPVPSPLNTGPWYADLGKLPCPPWSDPVFHGYSGVQMKAQVPFVGLYAARVAGAGALTVDYLYFVPADDSTVIVSWPGDVQVYALDGTTDAGGSAYATVAALDEVITTSAPPQITAGGGFPQLTPGATNRIHMLRDVDPTGGYDDVTYTTTIRAYYWPRWRESVRP